MKAREAYRKAESILKKEIKVLEFSNLNRLKQKLEIKIGKLYLAMNEYKDAEEYLKKALEKDGESAEAYSSLGVIYIRQEEFKRAIECLEAARRRDPDDLEIRTNLAQAYFKAGLFEKAEAEYREILDVTSYHVESHIGLGEVYTAMGEAGDGDRYDQAIRYFTETINIRHPENWSKSLNKKELAAVYYSRGYTQIKRYEASRTRREEKQLLQISRDDFSKCYQNDPNHYKGKRALEKIEERLRPFSSNWLTEYGGPTIIFILAFFLLLSSQFIFIIGKPVFEESFSITEKAFDSLKAAKIPEDILKELENIKEKKFIGSEEFLSELQKKVRTSLSSENKSLILKQTSLGKTYQGLQPIKESHHIMLTFGMLIFMIFGLYLPQILKLKVGSLELEKSAVDQLKTPGMLGISK